MGDALAPIDRRTLSFWRASNLAGWSAAGLALALGIHWIAAEYSDRYFGQAYLNLKWEWFTGWGILPSFAYRLGISLVIGVAVGMLVGRNAWKWQVRLAAVVAAAYAFWSIFAVVIHAGPVETFRAGPQEILVTGVRAIHGFGGYAVSGWIHDVLTLMTIPVAALAARFVARRRP